MSGQSTTRTVPGSGGSGTARTGRTGQVLSNVAVALGLVLFLGGFAWGAVVYRPYTVPTTSMAPTIDAGERVLAERVDGGEVRRGDVVVFRDATWSNAPMVKRVVAVGGDTVACCGDGKLTVNGKEIDEPYLPDDPMARSSVFPEVTVPKGRLFLLGDERSGSLDSTAHLTDAAAAPSPATPSRPAWTPWSGRWTACSPSPPASRRSARSPHPDRWRACSPRSSAGRCWCWREPRTGRWPSVRPPPARAGAGSSGGR